MILHNTISLPPCKQHFSIRFGKVLTDYTKFYLIIAAETACWDLETIGLENRRKTGKNISGDIDLLFDLYLFYGCVELIAPEEGGAPAAFFRSNSV